MGGGKRKQIRGRNQSVQSMTKQLSSRCDAVVDMNHDVYVFIVQYIPSSSSNIQVYEVVSMYRVFQSIQSL